MAETKTLEFWQQGPVDGVPALLQPVAHALLQARKEVTEAMLAFPDDLIWERPNGAASCGFHLQHLTGVIDRLFTYARNEKLNEQQFAELALEGKEASELSPSLLVERFSEQVARAIEQLKRTDESSLTEFRAVGRAGLPSTVIGLLFHAAEHTMRHVGQLLVTSKVLSFKS